MWKRRTRSQTRAKETRKEVCSDCRSTEGSKGKGPRPETRPMDICMQPVVSLCPIFQQDGNAKRAKLASVSNIQLQDLPTELVMCILVEAVAGEVRDTKLVKRVWKEKAELVIDRLRNVCPEWNSILMTSFFRNQLHRTLEGTAPMTSRLEILHKSPIRYFVSSVTTMKNEIFLLCRYRSRPAQQRPDPCINVFDRGAMEEVKRVIQLPGLHPRSIAACGVSNCVYVLNRGQIHNHFSILRVARNDESTVAPLMGDMRLPRAALCVAANGNLVVSRQQNLRVSAITVYDANGAYLHELRIPEAMSLFFNVIPKSNGNLVVASAVNTKLELMETDIYGGIVRQYQSSLIGNADRPTFASHADKHGRTLIVDGTNRMELLDSEFNLMNLTDPPMNLGCLTFPIELHCNHSETDEIVAVMKGQIFKDRFLVIFRLT